MSSQDSINYGKAIGIDSLAAPIVFAIAYVPCFGWFLRQSFKRPNYVFFVLTFFCSVRITAFIIRAVLAGSSTAGHNLGLLIADQVLFGVGFFGLLYSAYTLVLDRWLLANIGEDVGVVSRIISNRKLFRLVLIAGVGLGIAGASQSSSSNINKGNSLRIASTAIFLFLTVLLVYKTMLLTRLEIRFKTGYASLAMHSLGKEYGAYILCAISLLLLLREVFATATIADLKTQYNEHFWYPLYALPEIIAVFLYSVPGLVPPRSEIPQS